MAPSINTRLLEGEALSDRSRLLAVVARRRLISLRNYSRVGPLGHGIVPPVGRCDMRIERPRVMRTFKGVGILWPRPFRHPEFLPSLSASPATITRSTAKSRNRPFSRSAGSRGRLPLGSRVRLPLHDEPRPAAHQVPRRQLPSRYQVPPDVPIRGPMLLVRGPRVQRRAHSVGRRVIRLVILGLCVAGQLIVRSLSRLRPAHPLAIGVRNSKDRITASALGLSPEVPEAEGVHVIHHRTLRTLQQQGTLFVTHLGHPHASFLVGAQMTPSDSSSAILVLEKPHSLPRMNSLSAPTGLSAHLWRGGESERWKAGPWLWTSPKWGSSSHSSSPRRWKCSWFETSFEFQIGWLLNPSLFRMSRTCSLVLSLAHSSRAG